MSNFKQQYQNKLQVPIEQNKGTRNKGLKVQSATPRAPKTSNNSTQQFQLEMKNRVFNGQMTMRSNKSAQNLEKKKFSQ